MPTMRRPHGTANTEGPQDRTKYTIRISHPEANGKPFAPSHRFVEGLC